MKKLLSALALAAGLASCVSVDEKLGGDLIATNQQYDIYTAEIDLDEILMKSVDSLSAYSSRRMSIGAIRDDTFGLYRRGCALTLVPVQDTVDYGTNPVFQRFVFHALSDSVSVADLNQAKILQNVNVYAMTEPLDEDNYFSRVEVKHGSKRITKGIPVVNGSDTLSFTFTSDYGKQYMNITQSDLEDMDQYKKKFPGIYLCTDDPVGNGGRINMFDFNILDVSSGSSTRTDNYAALYWNAEFDGEKRDTMLMFYYSPLEFQDLDSLYDAATEPDQYVFNVDYHEKSDQMIGPAADKIYLEGGSGLKPVVPASEIKRLVEAEIKKHGGDPSTALISKATIELPFEFPDDYTTMFRYPVNLSPTVKISTDTTVTFAGLTDASVSTENQGDINRSLCNYAPDITHHVQQIITLDDETDLSSYDVWFLIMWYETTVTNDSSASELADYYQQLAYYSYYNSLYGGGYGGYSSYSGYSNYYSYMMMAQYASASASTSSTSTELDKDRYYNAVLNGPTSSSENKPKLRLTIAIPKK